MLESVIYWLTETIFALGYPGIVVLMALESSFFPFPSEVVMPPAGYLAAQGKMNLWVALGCGVAGSLLGAAFNYALARRLGRPLLHRYGRYFFVRTETLVRAEAFFQRHGEIGTFIGRLIPLIRQYISLPAGLSRMRLDRFALYTAAGAAIWCTILVWIGWFIGQHASVLEQEKVRKLSTWATLALVPFIAILLAWYIRRHRRQQKGQNLADTPWP